MWVPSPEVAFCFPGVHGAIGRFFPEPCADLRLGQTTLHLDLHLPGPRFPSSNAHGRSQRAQVELNEFRVCSSPQSPQLLILAQLSSRAELRELQFHHGTEYPSDEIIFPFVQWPPSVDVNMMDCASCFAAPQHLKSFSSRQSINGAGSPPAI
jgi:hypothetical protein